MYQADPRAADGRIHEIWREKIPGIDHVQRCPADEKFQHDHEQHPYHLGTTNRRWNISRRSRYERRSVIIYQKDKGMTRNDGISYNVRLGKILGVRKFDFNYLFDEYDTSIKKQIRDFPCGNIKFFKDNLKIQIFFFIFS